MKKYILAASFACTMLLTLVYCSKTPDKPVKEIPASNQPTDFTKTDVSVIKESASSSEDSLAIKVKDYVNSQFLNPEDLRAIEVSERKLNLYQIDLNNDGKKEIFINFFTPYFCGSGGCTLALLDNDLKLINKLTVTRTPISIDSKTENGWKVLWLQDGNAWKILKNKNGKYPSNPSLMENTKEVPEKNALKLFEANKLKSYSF